MNQVFHSRGQRSDCKSAEHTCVSRETMIPINSESLLPDVSMKRVKGVALILSCAMCSETYTFSLHSYSKRSMSWSIVSLLTNPSS